MLCEMRYDFFMCCEKQNGSIMMHLKMMSFPKRVWQITDMLMVINFILIKNTKKWTMRQSLFDDYSGLD